jgi:hypothetical protein
MVNSHRFGNLAATVVAGCMIAATDGAEEGFKRGNTGALQRESSRERRFVTSQEPRLSAAL